MNGQTNMVDGQPENIMPSPRLSGKESIKTSMNSFSIAADIVTNMK